MKLTPAQFASWYEITVRFVFKNPSYQIDTSVPLKKGDISGLRQGIIDLLAMHSGDFELDRRLKAAGLPSFDEMTGALRGKEKAILRCGKIRNEEELYVVKEALDGFDGEMAPREIAKLEAMMADYTKKSGSRTLRNASFPWIKT